MPKWLWKMINTLAIIKTPALIRGLVPLGLVLLGLAATSLHAASLNKCVDIYGKVTYSNLACKGAQQARKVEIDPAPPVPPVVVVPVPSVLEPQPTPVEKNGTVKLETFGTAPKKQANNTCDTLSDKLGLVLDKMDAARRKGYTQTQMDKWNLDIRELELKKKQASCF